MVAFAHDDVLVQVWIGVKDKLPRRSRAIYSNDPTQLRHQMDLSNWRLDGPVPAGAFTSARAAAAKRIPFARPEPSPPRRRRQRGPAGEDTVKEGERHHETKAIVIGPWDC